MRLHLRTAWLSLALLLTCSSFAQEPQATLSISCDEDCSWKLDGDRGSILKKDEKISLTLPFGRHKIEASLADGRSWEKTVDVTEAKREIRIGFVTEAPADTPNVTQLGEADSVGGIPKFYAESRQVLVGATVWIKTERPFPELPESMSGVDSKDFHIFENDVEQSINFFKEFDFPNAWSPGYWAFSPTPNGMWGSDLIGRDDRPPTIYLLGYVPTPLLPGECRTIRAVAKEYSVYLSRNQYCNRSKSDSPVPASPEETALRAKMRTFATSKAHASVKVDAQTYTFRSSGVVYTSDISSAVHSRTIPSSDFDYVIEVHDSKALASVKIAAEFSWPELHWEYRDGQFYFGLRVLGMIYSPDGNLVGQLEDVFRHDDLFPSFRYYRDSNLKARYSVEDIPLTVEQSNVPNRFDTQVELPPGEYELRLVVSDGGKNFGRTRVPFRVERFDSHRISMSDLAFSDAFDKASTVAYHTALVAPDPLVPTPLVSKDVEFYPATKTQFSKHNPVFLYFEIYEPLLEKEKPSVYIRLRVTNLKTGVPELSTHWMSAAKWVQPGNAVIPVGVKLETEKLKEGSYKLEVQASDSAGLETEWRQSNFSIE